MHSFQFLDTLLENLVQNLIKSNHKFKIFDCFDENEKKKKPRKLLLRKRVFPYSYFQSLSVFNDVDFPFKSAIYNRLTENDTSEQNYKHALAVYKALG